VRDIEFVKGHGTENDFVVLPDAEGVLDLTEPRVRALCDRSRGLGADGVLRVIRASALADPSVEDDGDGWFMDYRNADGSVAEMCGNGVRVFARYLVEAGLAERGEFVIGTRNGPRVVQVHQDLSVTVHMGQAKVFGRSSATVAGEAFDGVAVDVGNPHLVCPVDFDLATVDLTVPPGRDPVLFPHGANVEFVREVPPDALRMRVHERGVGETRSCGTGTVAAVAAILHLRGRTSGRYTVDIPGGRVLVEVGEHGSTLTGPAVLVARGQLDAAWWAAAGS
jgi:diaminopimelate epimerase